MIGKCRTTSKAPVARWYRGADIPMRVIRRFARQVAERFHPDKIILFGSYAYGTPRGRYRHLRGAARRRGQPRPLPLRRLSVMILVDTWAWIALRHLSLA
jgi:hypothetical protein